MSQASCLARELLYATTVADDGHTNSRRKTLCLTGSNLFCSLWGISCSCGGFSPASECLPEWRNHAVSSLDTNMLRQRASTTTNTGASPNPRVCILNRGGRIDEIDLEDRLRVNAAEVSRNSLMYAAKLAQRLALD